MKLSVIQIGNSKGVRLSKTILERYNIKDAVEVVFEKNQLILRPLKTPRKGWDKAFKELHRNKDDQLLMDDVFEDEDFDEWN